MVLTVEPQGDAPTISELPLQLKTFEDTTVSTTFKVKDSEGGTLTITAASSNTTLVPVNNIVLGGSGANRTVTITPASGQTGSSTITLTVTDAGGLTDTDTFVLTVSANTAPTISDIANQTMTTGTTLGPIAFTIGDAETAGALTVTATSGSTTILPNSGLVLGEIGRASCRERV